MQKSYMRSNFRCVKNKWALKIICNYVYWACLVACGYSQVLSVDFSKNYSLVVNDIIFHILLLMVIHFVYSAKIVDAKTIFLYQDFEEEINMEYPQ